MNKRKQVIGFALDGNHPIAERLIRGSITLHARNVARQAASLEKVSPQRRRTARIRKAGGRENISREAVFERDGGRCHICGDLVEQSNWHLDHLVPVVLGGQHTMLNVAVSHPQCNIRRGARGPAQLRLV